MIEWLVPEASTYARDIDWLFTSIFLTVGFWFLLAQAVFFWLLFRFRRRDGVPAQYITGEEKAEKRWISIPHALVIACDVFLIAATVMVWRNVKQVLPPADETIRVIGQQWAWTFVHPGPDQQLGTEDDVTEVNELHVTNGTVYHFELTSKDVLHSFSVPAFRLKQDAVPGRIITGWFQPTTIGQYDIQCAEICGIGHALMPARLYVETESAHAAWLRDRQA
ncbi:cytochrome C oxidase subunit II [bacterium]|nr:cytochrome C oxidase subunit II [bacterium]